MEGHATGRLLTIGQLSRLTGVPVRTIRFYSDTHLIVPAGRSAKGYRLYDVAAAARLELVRTLRELDIDLPTVAKVLAQEVTVAEVARTHAEALEATVRTIRLRQAVLRAVAVRGCDWEEMELMHRLARLDADERKRILDGFLDTVFSGLEGDGGAGGSFEAMIRGVFPELPADPSGEQVEAWVELVTLIQDEDFVSRVRQMVVRGAAKRISEADTIVHQQAYGDILAAGAAKAYAEGVDPTSPEGVERARAIVSAWTAAIGEPDTPEQRVKLLDDLETFTDRRVDRFWRLVAIVSDQVEMAKAAGSSVESMEWLIEALRAAR